MIGRIRKLMRAPLARPPGFTRHPRLYRFAPEWGMACLYTATFANLLWSPGALGSLLGAASIAYATAMFVLILYPMSLAVLLATVDRSRGATESLLLTPLDRSRLVWGRFLNVTIPWLRAFVYLLPAYFVIAGSIRVGYTRGWPNPILHALDCAFSLVPLFVAELAFDVNWGATMLRWNGSGFLLILLRLVNDLSVFLFVTGASLYISTGARSTVRAMLRSFVLVPAALLSVLMLDYWWLYLHDLLDSPLGNTVTTAGYGILAVSMMLLRFFLAWYLVRRTARNFDWYALGEEPPAGKASRSPSSHP